LAELLVWTVFAVWDSSLTLSWRAPALTVCAESESALWPLEEKNMIAQMKAAKVNMPTTMVRAPCKKFPVLGAEWLVDISLLAGLGALLMFLAYSTGRIY
jgi:hypothetical protein